MCILTHFLPNPPFPKHSLPSSSCILCLGTTTCPTNQVRNHGVILDFPQLYPISLEAFSSIALKCIHFSLLLQPVSWLVVALTTHSLDHWQQVVSGLQSPCQCAPPPLAAVANAPLSKMFYLLLQLKSLFLVSSCLEDNNIRARHIPPAPLYTPTLNSIIKLLQVSRI